MTDEASNEAYKRGLARLVERVRSLKDPWNTTVERKEVEKIAERLQEVAALLAASGFAQSHIEAVHAERGEPEVTFGFDGYPVTEEPFNFVSYLGTRLAIEELAASAREAADQFPDPRQKQALHFAATGLLHLRHVDGTTYPVLSNNSDDVIELEQLCKEAGIFLARETLRNALAHALKNFDPHCMGPFADLF
jgi:hypothetical protein